MRALIIVLAAAWFALAVLSFAAFLWIARGPRQVARGHWGRFNPYAYGPGLELDTRRARQRERAAELQRVGS